jgi:hypothetical protein
LKCVRADSLKLRHSLCIYKNARVREYIADIGVYRALDGKKKRVSHEAHSQGRYNNETASRLNKTVSHLSLRKEELYCLERGVTINS